MKKSFLPLIASMLLGGSLIAQQNLKEASSLPSPSILTSTYSSSETAKDIDAACHVLPDANYKEEGPAFTATWSSTYHPPKYRDDGVMLIEPLVECTVTIENHTSVDFSYNDSRLEYPHWANAIWVDSPWADASQCCIHPHSHTVIQFQKMPLFEKQNPGELIFDGFYFSFNPSFGVDAPTRKEVTLIKQLSEEKQSEEDTSTSRSL